MTSSAPAALPANEPSRTWLRGLRGYLATIAVGNLLWESLQLPLYTIWSAGTVREQAFAVVHCTGGDILIALSALTLALVVMGDEAWPRDSFGRVAGLTVLFGLAYAVFSEWLNVVVRASWAYSDWMPIVSMAGLHIGLAPLLQWIVVPTASLVAARRPTVRKLEGG